MPTMVALMLSISRPVAAVTQQVLDGAQHCQRALVQRVAATIVAPTFTWQVFRRGQSCSAD
jgi:hypothetical protein